MVVGFNHNFSYKGAVYHIQTEDSGVKSPAIVTLLYRGGTILASRKTSYADISRVDNLDQVVEELMKEQHKGMLRSLKQGEFDEAIDRFENSSSGAAKTSAAENPVINAAPSALPGSVPPPPAPPPPRPAVVPPVSQTVAPAPAANKKPASGEASLDEIILSYLMGEEK
jgi:hypothetical protein